MATASHPRRASDSPDPNVARLEAALRAKSAELDALLDMIPVGIGIATDSQCKSIRVNRAFAGVLGLATSQNASMSADPAERPTNFQCVDLNGRPIPAEDLPMQVAAREGREIRDAEFDIVHSDGHVVRLLEYATPLFDEAGQPRGSVGVFLDVTQRRFVEERNRLRLTEIAHANRLSMLGEAISEVAHELSQPLSAAHNFATACRQQALNLPAEQISEFLDKIVGQIERANDIVRHTTGFARRDQGRVEVICVNALIQDVVALASSWFVSSPLGQSRVGLRCELAAELPPVEAERVQIEQVLINLIRNGIEAVRETTGPGDVLVRTSLAEGMVRISVSDTGGGVYEATAMKLFQPFFTTKSNGLGLGLAISRSIVESYGGRLWVEPGQAAGAVFSLTIPIDCGGDRSS